MAELRRSLLICKCLGSTKQAVGSSSKCRVRSKWVPPGHPDIDAYIRLLSRELSEYDVPVCPSNMSWLDRKAQAWLRKHAAVVSVVDCDKGLGDALVPRSWVLEQVNRQLSQGYVQVEQGDFLTAQTRLKQQADCLVQWFGFRGVCSEHVRKFLLSAIGVRSAGVFRVLVKVHKTPVSSRPICNLRHVWFTPFSTFLCEQLGPLLSGLFSVINSTDQLLDHLESLRCERGMQFITLDIVNLYPSVSRQHLLEVVGPFLRRNFPDHDFCTFLIRVLELVLEACVVSFGGNYFESRDGIPTGLSVASIVANIYLWHFDQFLLQQSGLQLIRRYIDDLLLLWSRGVLELVELANSWHPNLKFEISGVGAVNFLDLSLSIQADRSVHWAMYHKPQNLYLYIPAGSNHPPSCFKSLQIGGAWRCERRNKLKKDEMRCVQFFKQCLKDRGYSLRSFDTLIARHYAQRGKQVQSKVSNRFLKIPFNLGIRRKWLKATIQKFSPLLHTALPDLKIGLCWAVGRNLFRRRYNDVWNFGA